MSLPSLDRLGTQASSSSQRKGDGTEKQPFAYWSYSAHMMCLQDENASSLSAALDMYRFLDGHREKTDGWTRVFDDEVEHGRYVDAVNAGRVPPAPPMQFHKWQLEQAKGSLDKVKQRLANIAARLKRDLHAQVWLGPKDDPHNNMGFSTTLTDRYGEEDYYRFHQAIHPNGYKRFLPENAEDWHMLTMIYYMVDPANAQKAAEREGQGSTLVNLHNTYAPETNTQVAFCPLRNGSITVLDGRSWHAVGPNYGVPRGAVVLKAILYKPDSKVRNWSHDEWWSRAEMSMLDLASEENKNYRAVKHRHALLRDVLRKPDDSPF